MTAAKPNLLFIDGVRALSSIGVVMVHCYRLWGYLLPPGASAAALTREAWLPWVANQAGVGADILLVVSGMLAALPLLKAFEGGNGVSKEGNSVSGRKVDSNNTGSGAPAQGSRCRQTVLSYWRKRAQRILPAYLATHLVIAVAMLPSADRLPAVAKAARGFAFPACPSGLWANALFLTNRLGSLRSCGIYFWSVSVQVHWFATFPLLLWALRPQARGFQARVAAALAAIVLGSTAWRFWAASQAGFQLPMGDISLPEEQEGLVAFMDSVYFPTASRVGQLAAGAALGMVLRSPPALSWLAKRPALVSGTAIALQAFYLSMFQSHNLFAEPNQPRMPPHANTTVAALLTYGGPFYSALSVATLLALMLRTDPLHAAAARLLSSPVLRPVAALSYELYLLHELARFGALLLLPPTLLPTLAAHAPLHALAAFIAITLAAGYAAAWLCNRLVRRWSCAA